VETVEPAECLVEPEVDQRSDRRLLLEAFGEADEA
jgi:hypothetical protein